MQVLIEVCVISLSQECKFQKKAAKAKNTLAFVNLTESYGKQSS